MPPAAPSQRTSAPRRAPARPRGRGRCAAGAAGIVTRVNAGVQRGLWAPDNEVHRAPSTGSTRWRRRLVPRLATSAGSGGCRVSRRAADRLAGHAARRSATWRAAFVFRRRAAARRARRRSSARWKPPEEISGRVRPFGRQHAQVHAHRDQPAGSSTRPRRRRWQAAKWRFSRRTSGPARTRDRPAARTSRPPGTRRPAQLLGDHREDESVCASGR